MGRLSWTLSKLSQAFDRLVRTQSHGLKFCLFVDGLDEYDGDYFEVIKIFTRISESLNVKVCLSSRPLSDFVVAFKTCQSLRLQDLTFNDIHNYINYELGINPHMQALRENKPEEANSLVSEIVNKADGVFLWVKLVVLSLLRGLRQSDEIRDLQMRLKLLPPSLEDLFSHILGRLDPVYLEQSSRIFQIFAEAQKINDASLTCLELSFAEELDSNSVIQESTRQCPVTELLERSSQVETWLRTRCGGLIETYSCEQACNSSADARLSYLHRTVRDFLELPEIWSIVLKPTSGKEFVPSVALLQSQVLYIKRVLPFPTDLMHRISDIQKFATRAIAFARQAETATSKPQVTMLDELDRVCNELLKGFVQGPYSWTTEANHDDTSAFRDETAVHQNSLIALAIQSGLYFYVAEKLKLEPWLVENKGGRPLLHYAISAKNALCIYELQVQPSVVELLLSHGAQVDEVYEKVSAWELVLESLFLLLARGASKKTVKKWLSIVKLFLEHGADPAQCIGNDPSKLAYSLVHALCDSPHEVKALLVSPGILAERAEEARRTQQALELSRKKGSTNEKDSLSDSSQLLLTREERNSRSLEMTRQAAQPVVVPGGSSAANKMEEVPRRPPKIERTEAPISHTPETSESKNQSRFQGPEQKTIPVNPATQYQEQGLALQSRSQKVSSEVQDGMLYTIATGQSWESEPSQWMSSQQVSLQLPPPIPPKIPILIETCYELQGSPVPVPSTQVFEANHPCLYPFWPSAQPSGSTQWGGSQPNLHNSHGHVSPIYVNALHPRPRSTQAIPLPLERSGQPGLSHHRSFNSLSFTQNASSQTYHRGQYDYSQYPRSPPFQQSSHPPPAESHNYSPPIYNSQQSPETSSPTPHINTTYVVQDPILVGSDASSSHTQPPTLPPPLPPRPNPYSSHQFVQPIPSSISSPHQHHQVYQNSTNPYLPNSYQQPPPSQFPHSLSQSFNSELRNQHMSQNQYQAYSPPYISSSSQYTAPSFQQSPGPSQNGSPTLFEQKLRPESAPNKNPRARSWMERLTKSLHT
jgi:hypothetical protein